jgi:hypothetical protein
MARVSEYQPFPAKNKMMQVFMPEKTVPLEEIIPSAIRENMDFMLNTPISNEKETEAAQQLTSWVGSRFKQWKS